MPSQTPTAFASRFQLSTADLQLFRTNSFRLIQFRKNASANPLVSHSFKTKDLKPFRFTHFQKKGGGTPAFPLGIGLLRPLLRRISSSRFGRRTGIVTEHRSRTTPVSFPGGTDFGFRFSSFADSRHESRIASHKSRLSVVRLLSRTMRAPGYRCPAQKMGTRIYLSLGSNLGDRAAKIASGIAALGEAGIRVLRQS